MWIQTETGNLVNLKKSYYICIIKQNDYWELIAYFPFSYGDQDDMKQGRISLFSNKEKKIIESSLIHIREGLIKNELD